MFSFKTLSNQNGPERKLNTVSVNSACMDFQPISFKKVSLFERACVSNCCLCHGHIFAKFRRAYPSLHWGTGCYRWSPDSPHMVPRWSPQSLGGHTWVNRVSLPIGQWGHWPAGLLRVILLPMIWLIQHVVAFDIQLYLRFNGMN